MCYCVFGSAGLWLTLYAGGPILLAYGVFGAFWSMGYALPVVTLSSRGLGEIGMLLNIGPVMGAVAFTVASAGHVAVSVAGLEGALITLPFGLLGFSLLLVQNVFDETEDRIAGKNTLAVRLGPSRALSAASFAFYAVFVVIGLMAALRFVPPLTWLVILLAPISYRELTKLRVASEDRAAFETWIARYPLYELKSAIGLALVIVFCISSGFYGNAKQVSVLLCVLAFVFCAGRLGVAVTHRSLDQKVQRAADESGFS